MISGPPSVTVSPALLEATPGRPATLICDAEGYGDITVKWFRVDGQLPPHARDDGYGYLEFSTITAADAGRWVSAEANSYVQC